MKYAFLFLAGMVAAQASSTNTDNAQVDPERAKAMLVCFFALLIIALILIAINAYVERNRMR